MCHVVLSKLVPVLLITVVVRGNLCLSFVINRLKDGWVHGWATAESYLGNDREGDKDVGNLF